MLSWLLLLAGPPCGPTTQLGLPQIAPQGLNLAPQASGSTAQEPAPETPIKVTTEPESPSPSDPAALALFEKLIKAQATEENLPAVVGFAVDMSIRLYLPEGGNDFVLGLYFKTEPMETVRLIVDDANHGTRVQKGFDSDGFWLRDADGNLISLDGHEFEQDREAIDESMVLCNDFLLLFDLKRLKGKASELQLQNEEDRTLIRGKLRRGREKWGFELHIPKGQQLPSRLSLQPPAVIPKKPAKPAEDEAEPTAGQTAPAVPVLPPRLHYEFGDWVAFEGRQLPSWIDEFHAEDLKRPLRVMEINDFLWRDAEKLQTSRGADKQGD